MYNNIQAFAYLSPTDILFRRCKSKTFFFFIVIHTLFVTDTCARTHTHTQMWLWFNLLIFPFLFLHIFYAFIQLSCENQPHELLPDNNSNIFLFLWVGVLWSNMKYCIQRVLGMCCVLFSLVRVASLILISACERGCASVTHVCIVHRTSPVRKPHRGGCDARQGSDALWELPDQRGISLMWCRGWGVGSDAVWEL